METTMEIEDGLFEQARTAAQRKGTTLRVLVEEGLRLSLERLDPPRKTHRMRDLSYGGGERNKRFTSERMRDGFYAGRGA
jgi:hypothetical protein